MLMLADVERAIATRDPQLGSVIVRYLAQDDPEDGRGELAPTSDDAPDDEPEVDVPPGAVTLDHLAAAVSPRGLAHKTATERKLARREAFAAAEASPFAPPRLRLGELLIELYERGEPPDRAALAEMFAEATMKWGVWRAAKAIYKRAEDRHDLAMFGVLAYRFDAMRATPHASRELGAGTLLYLRRRAWRYLRLLGQAVPDAYPAFAVEVLRHYPADYAGDAPSWVAAQIWGHGHLGYARGSAEFAPPGPDDDDAMQVRAFPAAWKLAPAPLLGLLEAAANELVCGWAIRCLRADHPLALRAVEPAWLARLGRRPVAAVHAFVVALLRDGPALHQSKLRELGLHEVVVGFLRSPSDAARSYALEYCAAHAPELAVDELVALIEDGADEVARFAAARLEARPASELGIAAVLRLLGAAAAPWAEAKLAGFAPEDLDAAQFIATAARGTGAFHLMVKFYTDKRAAVPTGHWRDLLDDPRFIAVPWQLRSIVATALTELGARTATEIGVAWIQRSLEDRRRTDAVTRWLDAGMLAGDQLDADWLKALVGKPRLRPIACKLLADRRRMPPARVGLAWLLEQARSSDAELAQFAHRMLLESFEPQDFAAGAGEPAGVARLWELAAGRNSPEAVRGFAATYLRAHHPELGLQLAEAKALGIEPRLDHDAYPLATLRPLLFDDRADVRRLAAAIAGAELVRWGDRALVYELAGALHKEPRGLGSELLLGVLLEDRPDVRRVPAAWVDGRRLFELAESAHKAAREVALTLIRRLYDRVGGAERLAWLMDSPERDVRLFAVRLFWDRHRPTGLPVDYAPRRPATSGAIGTSRFTDVAALRQFTRTVLFGLPPGRIGERDPVVEGAPRPERGLPASVAKRRLIEALRDVALDELELARAVAPVLREFTASTAKGEWHASVQALTALRAHHAETL
jgi:hypothetical protein